MLLVLLFCSVCSDGKSVDDTLLLVTEISDYLDNLNFFWNLKLLSKVLVFLQYG